MAFLEKILLLPHTIIDQLIDRHDRPAKLYTIRIKTETCTSNNAI